MLRARVKDVPDRLAPSFDHGGSLGYNLTDDKRCLLLDSDAALAVWAAKGAAQRFEHVRPSLWLSMRSRQLSWLRLGP